MLATILKNYNVYGDEENDFDCCDIFKEIIQNLEDDEADIQVIFRYLLERTDFAKWIDDTYHSSIKNESCTENCDECQFKDNEENFEQIDIFNAQSEILKNTQEELKALKKKYNKLLRKYKGLSD